MAPRFTLLDASFDDDHAGRNFRRAFDADVERFAVREGELPADPDRFDAAVLSGSRAGVGDDAAWIADERAWVGRAFEADLPLLGVCFGHQLLAAALGGRVEPMGEWEVGYHEVQHATAPLFDGVDEWFTVFTVHEDAVTRLPLGARLLAANNYCVQSFARPPAFGVQFHAEFPVDSAAHVMRERGLPERHVERVVGQLEDGRHDDVETARRVLHNFEAYARERR